MSAAVVLAIRIGAAAAVFAAMALWEWLAPRRRLATGRLRRWPGNLGIWAIDSVAIRLLGPLTVVGAALFAADKGWGLFVLLGLPYWAALVVGVIALDLVIYAQHVIFHHVPWLWRLHRMHHADLDIDVTTGVRFHPLEILLSVAIKMAAVVMLGVPAEGVVIFEVLLNATSLFNHSNVALPSWLERVVRCIVVTPQMHQVHHSIAREETDSNFGFNLTWWDRLFGTYRSEPKAGEVGLTVGLPIFREVAELRVWRLLTQPFRPGNSVQSAESPDQNQDRQRYPQQP
jgi:sterol desaturase/sphingolipid hydroxylase (fatty acid hydroxylase superfamily)